MLILGIDPGSSKYGTSHTGIVLMKVPNDSPAYLEDSWAVRGGLDGFRAWSDKDNILLRADLVVVETFVDRQILGADRSPLLIEGAVRFLRRDTVLSPASGYKSVVPDEVLRRFGLWFTGDHHADRRSAARHVLRYLLKNHPPSAEFGWGWIKEKT